MRKLPLVLSTAVLAAAGALWFTSSDVRAASRPHILLVLVDTLRADHLGAYGYARDTSPTMDALAADGALFLEARSVAPWTNPTIATLFTGLYPQSVLPPASHGKAIQHELPAGLPTMAELLKGAGYHTVGLVDHPGLVPGMNWAQGFDDYVRLYDLGSTDVWANTPPDLILEHLRASVEAAAAPGSPPLFVYLHLVYPHRPLDPPDRYDGLFGEGFEEFRRGERAGIVNTYDAEIRFTDDVLADVLDVWRDADLLRDTWVVLTSDHGEAFWEHGAPEHGHAFHEELLHVPLIVRPPGALDVEPRVVERAVSHVDLLPTVLQVADVGAPPDLPGRSYLPLVLGEEVPRAPIRFSESPSSGNVFRTAAWRGRYKLVRDGRDGELYDLVADPEETGPVEGLDELESELMRAIEEHRAENEERRGELGSEARPLDAETRARLRALGYTDS